MKVVLTVRCGQNLTAINPILGKRCYNLKILYLHENRIGQLENLHRLEELKYLNVALNQIEEVKGLENCRSLTKLDLTANRISPSKLHSIARLAANKSLEHLFLLGNPCTKKHFYRAFVIAVLPQLKILDGKRVTAEEQSVALEQQSILHQKVSSLDDSVAVCDENSGTQEQFNIQGQSAENAPCAHPVDAQARIFQTNQGKWKFKLSESEDKSTTLLEIPIGKRVETSDILVNIQPTYLECTIEGKLLRLMLFEEVLPMLSTASRSTATGRLLLSMPKAANHDFVCSAPAEETSLPT